MKAVCKTCGKKFDPDKTDFLCPKCGAWYITGNHYDIGNENNQSTIYDCDDCDHENKMASKEPKCHDTFDGYNGQTWTTGKNNRSQEWYGTSEKSTGQIQNTTGN